MRVTRYGLRLWRLHVTWWDIWKRRPCFEVAWERKTCWDRWEHQLATR